MGLPPVEENKDEADRDDYFPVWRDNKAAARLFLRCATQWRINAMTGMRQGLDYQAVESVAAMSHTRMSGDLIDDLRAIETGALEVFAAQAKADADRVRQEKAKRDRMKSWRG